jgi:hypothetical protein
MVAGPWREALRGFRTLGGNSGGRAQAQDRFRAGGAPTARSDGRDFLHLQTALLEAIHRSRDRMAGPAFSISSSGNGFAYFFLPDGPAAWGSRGERCHIH